MVGSLLWAMVDYWPGGQTDFSFDLFVSPLMNLIYAMAIALVGGLVLSRFLMGSFVERALVLGDAVNGATGGEVRSKAAEVVGAIGVVCKPLHPVGVIEIEGERYAARCEVGSLDAGAKVRVLEESHFNVIVDALEG